MIGIWTATEQKSFQAVIAGFQKAYPGRHGQLHVGGEQHADVLKTASPAGTRPTSPPCPARARADFARRARLKPLTFARA